MENLKFKGTSGEWKCYRKTDKHKIEQVRVGAEIICHVPLFMNEHSEANAKLIASAPKMLKALINTYLKLQILSNDNVSIAVKTDSERAELRNVISDALGLDAFDVQEYIETEAMYQKSLK